MNRGGDFDLKFTADRKLGSLSRKSIKFCYLRSHHHHHRAGGEDSFAVRSAEIAFVRGITGAASIELTASALVEGNKGLQRKEQR